MPESAGQLEAQINAAIASGFRERLLDRGLARGLIWHEGVLPADAPSFASTLTDDLLDYGHALLSLALRLRGLAPTSPILAKAFLVAGEALEAAINRGDPQRLDSGFHRVTAAVTFHLGRYAARAFSILAGTTDVANLSPTEKALVQLIRRSLDNLHEALASWLLTENHWDNAIAEQLRHATEPDHGDAIHILLTTGLMRGLALVDHAFVTGRGDSIELSKARLYSGLLAAGDLHAVMHWWSFTLSGHLIDELWNYSLHQRLPEVPPDHPNILWNDLRRNYILRLRAKSRAAIELWPSQLEAATRAVDQADNLVIALPTGAGKTRIAELCILRALADNSRAVYVTPLRALSAQVERDLTDTFAPLGYEVSSLYGSAGIAVGDTETLRTRRIVVSTPEKLDFALRNDTSILNDVGLIVLDEGHMLGPGEREVRYEALVQQLLRRDDAGQRRIVCLSALFPEPDKMVDMVGWIRRDRPGLPVHSSWRPTRQRYGLVQWIGRTARLEVQVDSERPFVPRFVEAKTPPAESRRRRTFPNDKNELTVATAWQFVGQDKDVLIYCARRISVETLGRLVLKCIEQGLIHSLVRPSDSLQEVIATGTEWLGTNHPAVRCLEYGIALHHGGLPRQFLAGVERLLQGRDCRVTIASPTLAQGLNLSASVLLVPSIWRREKRIPGTELANVAGRAGRAFIDLEGLVLHIIWEETPARIRRATRQWRELLAEAKATEVQSGLLQLSRLLIGRIAKASAIPEQEVIEYLAGNNCAWEHSALVEQRTEVTEYEWERDIASLDAVILGLLDIETEAANISEQLESALEGSLFFRQLGQLQQQIQSLIKRFIASRAQLIWAQTNTSQRVGYHSAGVGLRAGIFLSTHLDELVKLLLATEAAVQVHDGRSAADALARFAEIVFETAPFRARNLPSRWQEALAAWILGYTADAVMEIAGDGGVDFIQDAVCYRLAWATEAVRVYATAVNHSGAADLKGFSALVVEAGSGDRAVMTLLRSGLGSREVARRAVESTAAVFTDRAGMWAWLMSNEVGALSRRDDWPTSEGRLRWLSFIKSISGEESREWMWDAQVAQVEWSGESARPTPGTYVIVEPHDTKGVLVLTPDFVPLGRMVSLLARPRNEIVEVRVGPDPDAITIKFFGPIPSRGM